MSSKGFGISDGDTHQHYTLLRNSESRPVLGGAQRTLRRKAKMMEEARVWASAGDMDRGSSELVAVAWKQLMGGATVRTPRQLEDAGSTVAGALRGCCRPQASRNCRLFPICVVKFPSHKIGVAKS